jgi:DNA polymerase
MPTSEKLLQLEEARKAVINCKDCTICANGTPVFGDGNPDTGLVFIGEAAGGEEVIKGSPFVGKAGQLFTSLAEQAGLYRKEHYFISNVVRCRPTTISAYGNVVNRPPDKDEIDNCRRHLHRLMAILKPKLIVCLGSPALKTIIGPSMKITTSNGKLYNTCIYDVPAFALYHPSYLLRARLSADEKQVVEQNYVEELKKVKRIWQALSSKEK